MGFLTSKNVDLSLELILEIVQKSLNLSDVFTHVLYWDNDIYISHKVVVESKLMDIQHMISLS